jgi:hypothetical protein
MKRIAIAIVATLSLAAFAKGTPTAQTHHCVKDGAVLEKTKKECHKEGGTWEKMKVEKKDSAATPAPAPAAEPTPAPATK